MSTLFKVVSDPASASPRFNGDTAMIVQANSSNEAKAIAKKFYDGDADAVWAAATVTGLDTVVSALTGWVFRLQIDTMVAVDVSVTGDSNDTLDDIADKLVTALNATAIDDAAYDSGTKKLTVAAGGSDAIGDKSVTVTVTPPTGFFPAAYTWDQNDLIDSIVDGGMSSDDLEVDFVTTWVVPGVQFSYKA